VPWRARTVVHSTLRRGASGPQLKRDPLAGVRTARSSHATGHAPSLPRVGARASARASLLVWPGVAFCARRSRLALVRRCAGGDSLVLEVTLDGKSIYSSAFPICQRRRSAIKPEPQQRILEFRFAGVPGRFGTRYRATEPEPIEGNIWERRGERHAILLGVSFATDQRVLLNTVHVARADSPSRSERVRGLVILTRPARRSDRTPPNKRLKLSKGARFKGSGVLCPGGHALSSNSLAPACGSPAA